MGRGELFSLVGGWRVVIGRHFDEEEGSDFMAVGAGLALLVES